VTTAGQRLAAVQFAGHAAVNAMYRPLSAEIGQLVLQHAEHGADGVLRLTLAGRAVILRELGLRLDAMRPELYQALRQVVRETVEAAQVGVAPLSAGETVMLASSGQLLLSLASDRANVLGQTGALLLRGVAAGAAAATIAKEVKQYFSPFFAVYRDAKGNLVHEGREGAVKHWPGQAGMASQHARLVMLSETTAAHGRTMMRIAQRDRTLLRYHVSHKHLEIDECDLLERQDVGFGPGLYPPDQFPTVPRHPRCRCWAEPGPPYPAFLARSESVPA
jgi:hypothetical protein